jgi:ribosomal-protein-serine acetyltransferase
MKTDAAKISSAELHPVGLSHAEELFLLIDQNRAYLSRFLPWVEKTLNTADTEKFIRWSIEAEESKTGISWIIKHHEKISGVIGLHLLDISNRKTCIGYWISEDAQGKGIATEACKTVINYCFNHLNLNCIEIRCATENLKSRSIPERFKFKQTGIARQAEWVNNRHVDHAVYSLLKSDWK